MRRPEEKIVTLPDLAAVADQLRASDKKIVTTNGCFDLLHWGHMSYLQEARRLGDVLIIGLNSDASVQKLKGPKRPITPEDQRLLQLASLECVDYVCVFAEENPNEFLKAVKPHFHVKGADYKGKEMPEQKVLNEVGGEIVLLPYVEGLSTTGLIEKLKLLTDKH